MKFIFYKTLGSSDILPQSGIKISKDVISIMSLFLLSLQFYILSNLFFNILGSVFELKLYY